MVGSSFIVNVGTYVKEGEELFYLVNNDELRVQMNIPAVQSKAIALGQSVRIYRDRTDKLIAEGQINYVAPFFDLNSEGNSTSPANTLTVQASFPNVQVGLKPLELLQAEIQTGVRNLPAVPTSAISMKAQQAFVFKLIPFFKTFGTNAHSYLFNQQLSSFVESSDSSSIFKSLCMLSRQSFREG